MVDWKCVPAGEHTETPHDGPMTFESDPEVQKCGIANVNFFPCQPAPTQCVFLLHLLHVGFSLWTQSRMCQKGDNTAIVLQDDTLLGMTAMWFAMGSVSLPNTGLSIGLQRKFIMEILGIGTRRDWWTHNQGKVAEHHASPPLILICLQPECLIPSNSKNV